MEARTDHSTSGKPNLDNPDPGLERSRFLNALGFGRSGSAETTPEAGPAEASDAPAANAEEVVEVETGSDDATSFPAEGFQPGPAPKSFEPLEALDSEAPVAEEDKDKPSEEEATAREMASPADANEPAEPVADTTADEGADDDDEGSAHDPDGMALRGDEGGPDFLAARDDDETDDWEKALLVDHGEDGDESAVSMVNVENSGAPDVEAEEVPVEEPAAEAAPENADPMVEKGGFAWMLAGAKADTEEDDFSQLLVAGDEIPQSVGGEGDFSFLLNQGGEAKKEGSAESPEVAPKPLDFETFSQRLKSAPLWKAPERAEVLGDVPDSGESPETESKGEFDPESLLVDQGDEVEVGEAVEPAKDEPLPVGEAENAEEPEPAKPAFEAAALDSGDRGGEAGNAEALAETNTEAESSATPEPTQETMANSQSSPSPADRPEGSSPSSTTPANVEFPESKPGIAIAPAATAEIVDVACPECGKGLSLRREHLGIAGHCVWCESPLVAAASSADGAVRVFLLKPGAKPAVENQSPAVEPVESEAPGAPVSNSAPAAEEPVASEASATEVPLPVPEARISPWTGADQKRGPEVKPTAEAEPSDQAEPASIEPAQEAKLEAPVGESCETEKKETDSPVSEEVGETVEPEVLGSVEETVAEPETPAPVPGPAWQMPAATDATSSLWAERAAAVQQSLTGAGASPDPAVDENLSQEPTSQSPPQTEPALTAEEPKSSAPFSWMDPKPAPGMAPSPSPVEEKSAESESAAESDKVEAKSDMEEPSGTDQPWSVPVAKTESESEPAVDSGASAFAWKPPSSSTPSAEAAPDPKEDSSEQSTEPVETKPVEKPESVVPSENSPFNWKAPSAGDGEPSAKDDSAAKSEPDEAGKSVSSNDPFAGITAALAKASEAEEKAESAEAKSDVDSSGPFENLSQFLSDPAASSGSLLTPGIDEETPAVMSGEKKPADTASSSPASLWPGESGKKEGNDPFATAGSDETAESGSESAFEAKATESEAPEESEGLKSASAGTSLFAAAMGSAPSSKSAPESEPSPDSNESESEKADEPFESKAQPALEIEKNDAGKAEKVKSEPSKAEVKKAAKEESKAKRQAEQERKRAEKAKAVEAKSKTKKTGADKKKGGLIKWIFLALVIGGLLAGIAAAAMMREKLSETILPRLQPLLEKVMPSREEANPEAGAEIESASAAPVEEKGDQASLDVPVTGPVSTGEIGSVETANLSSTTEPPSVTTGSVRPAAKPAVVPVPEKKNLFGSGPLLINDGGTEENDSSSE